MIISHVNIIIEMAVIQLHTYTMYDGMDSPLAHTPCMMVWTDP